MKATRSKETFPSLFKLIIYLALIAAFCALNCLSLEAKDRPSYPVTKGNYEINNVRLPGVQYCLPQWLIGVYLDIALQPIYEKPENEASGFNKVQVAPLNGLSNFRSLTPGTTIVFPPLNKSSK